MRSLAVLILLVGFAGIMPAPIAAPAPEIDTNSSVAAAALLSGALLVLRARRQK